MYNALVLPLDKFTLQDLQVFVFVLISYSLVNSTSDIIQGK